MFDIAWSEFLVVAVVALVVVGPRDLPALLRNVGRMVASVWRMAGEFQSQFNDAMREAELDDLRREVSGLKDAAQKVAGPDPFQIAHDEIRRAVDGRPASAPAALSAAATHPDPSDEPAPSALAPAPVNAPIEAAEGVAAEPPAPPSDVEPVEPALRGATS